jgi:hypothetical protein
MDWRVLVEMTVFQMPSDLFKRTAGEMQKQREARGMPRKYQIRVFSAIFSFGLGGFRCGA